MPPERHALLHLPVRADSGKRDRGFVFPSYGGLFNRNKNPSERQFSASALNIQAKKHYIQGNHNQTPLHQTNRQGRRIYPSLSRYLYISPSIYLSIYLPIYLSIYQPTNQPINQSTNQSINQSINQPINQPTNQPINQPTNQPINQPIDESINPSIHLYVHFTSAVSTYLSIYPVSINQLFFYVPMYQLIYIYFCIHV